MNSLLQSRAAGSWQRKKVGWIYDSPLGASVYECWCGLTESQAHARAFNVASARPGESVLEVSTGTDGLLARLAEIEGLTRCVGLELSQAMLSRARRHFPEQLSLRHALCRGDARLLPLAAGTFDLIVNSYFMELLSDSDIRLALKEFRRALKRTGRLVLLVMAKQSWMLQGVWMWLYGHLPGLVGGCRPVDLTQFLLAEGWRINLREQISQLGFRSELILARPVC